MLSLIALFASAALPPATRLQLGRLSSAVAPYRDFAVAQGQGWTKFGGDAHRPLLRWLANGWMDRNWGKRGRLAMVHVWVGEIPSPDGVFAHANRAIPYAKLGLPFGFATVASEAAAKGLELATKGGCAESIDGGL